MTNAADVVLAVEAGADAVGVIVAESARRVPLSALAEIASAIPPFVSRIGVLANQGRIEADCLRALGFTLQFSGDESPETCAALAAGSPYIKVVHLEPQPASVEVERYAAYGGGLWMFDTRVGGRHGGSGRPFDWSVVAGVARTHRIVISGGLTPDNVAGCVRAVGPYAVDVRSGVESNGRKDAAKMRAFVDAVRTAAAGSVDCDVRLVEVDGDDFDWMLSGDTPNRRGFSLPPGGVDDPATLAHVRNIAEALNERNCSGAWMIVAGGEVVGLCGYRRPPHGGEAEIGYGVAASRRERGHATRAVAAIAAISRAAGVRSLTAETSVANQASGRVLEKNGFVTTGTRYDPEDGEVLTWQKYLMPAVGDVL